MNKQNEVHIQNKTLFHLKNERNPAECYNMDEFKHNIDEEIKLSEISQLLKDKCCVMLLGGI